MKAFPRTLIDDNTSLWYDLLPGWSLPKAFVLFPVFLYCVRELETTRFRYTYFMQQFDFFNERESLSIMPRKKGSKPDAKPTANAKYSQQVSWINVQLSEDDAAVIAAREYVAQDIAGELLALTLEGKSIGVKTAPNGDGWMCFLTGVADESDNQVVGLSGYADNPVDAVISLLYKFHDKLGSTLPVPSAQPTRRFR